VAQTHQIAMSDVFGNASPVSDASLSSDASPRSTHAAHIRTS
jgi:hypothetical protein